MPARVLCLLLVLLSFNSLAGLTQFDSASVESHTSQITTLEIKFAFLEDQLDKRDKISILEKLIGIKEKEENYLEAIHYSNKLLNTYTVDQVTVRSETIKKIGDLNYLMGDYYSAIGYYHTALHLDRASKPLEAARMLYKIGKAYEIMNDSSQAITIFNRALSYIKPGDDKSLYANILLEAGRIKRHEKKYKEAISLLNRALEHSLKLGDHQRLGSIYYNLGAIAYSEKQLEKSLDLAGTSFNYFRLAADFNGKAKCFMIMAHVMKNMDKGSIASEYYNQAIINAQRGGKLALLHDILTHAARNQEFVGNHKKAITLYKSAHAIQDSIAFLKSRDEIHDMQARYNFNSKQQEIETLKNEAEIKELTLNKNRISIITIITVAGLILLITLSLYQRNRYLYTKKITVINQKLLRMQMNPHFIFNALSAIQSFVLDNDPKEAGKYLTTFARLIRIVLENSKNEFVSIEKEKNLLIYYLELQQLRFNRRFEYNIFIDPAINTFEMMIPTMISQPFVENSIEHGIQGITERGIINISFKLLKEHIVLEVEDNGKGLNGVEYMGEKLLDHKSLATVVTGERLKLLNQKSKVKYNLEYTEANIEGSNNPGTKVTIKMPFKV